MNDVPIVTERPGGGADPRYTVIGAITSRVHLPARRTPTAGRKIEAPLNWRGLLLRLLEGRFL